MTDPIRLTHSVSCAGCAAKVDPRFLSQVLNNVQWPTHERVVIGFEHSDDAGVYAYHDGSQLVATTDFFTPIVDDPLVYGAAAAANALSDIYAMGGEPLFALSIVHYPESMGADILQNILQGAANICAEAACPIIGGHSIRSDQLSFGLAITGRIPPGKQAVANQGARPGDVLILTKALGTGILATASKKDCCPPVAARALEASLLRLNKHAGSLLHQFPVHAATDITGFGLIGHGCELASASQVDLHIHGHQLPLLPHLQEAIDNGCLTRGDAGNQAYAGERLHIAPAVDKLHVHAASDPQSSGGLLIAVAGDAADALVQALRSGGDTVATQIGEVHDGHGRLLLQ